jgi:hypothetical protein
MLDELNSLFPVQFIEGRNKSAEPGEISSIPTGAYILYAPEVSYSIAHVDIFLSCASVPKRQESKLCLYPAYLDHPSDIVLTEGTMVFEAGTEAYQGWRRIEISRPVVLIAHKKYWLRFTEVETDFKFYAAKEGDEINTMVKDDDKWHSSHERLMLRFFGRVIPVASRLV